MPLNGFAASETLIDPLDLVARLGKRVDELWDTQPHAPDGVWTLHVKEALGKIAKEVEVERGPDLSLDVIYTKPVEGVHEFLLDLVWWCRKNSSKYEFMGLAVEVEWGTLPTIAHAVGEDFSKLTVVKCPIKLMIFCTTRTGVNRSHEPLQQVVLAELDRYLSCYAHHIPGEHYVFVDIATSGNRRAWIRSVGQDGVLSALKEITS
jgi:hypothetical protein